MKTQHIAHGDLPGSSTGMHPDTNLTSSTVPGGRTPAIYTKIFRQTQGLPQLTEDFPPIPRDHRRCHADRGPAGKIPSNLHQKMESHSAGPQPSERANPLGNQYLLRCRGHTTCMELCRPHYGGQIRAVRKAGPKKSNRYRLCFETSPASLTRSKRWNRSAPLSITPVVPDLAALSHHGFQANIRRQPMSLGLCSAN